MGLSMGGYLAPRAAAFEHRIKALIANGGVYDFHALYTRGAPPEFRADCRQRRRGEGGGRPDIQADGEEHLDALDIQ